MDDRNIMENLLLNSKSVCDLYLHGTIESGTKNVHTAFCSALNESLCIQDTIYQKMSEKGWYSSTQAPQSDIEQVKQKFARQ